MTTILITILITWTLLGFFNAHFFDLKIISKRNYTLSLFVVFGPLAMLVQVIQECLIGLIQKFVLKKLKMTLPESLTVCRIEMNEFVRQMIDQVPDYPWFKHNRGRKDTYVRKALYSLIDEGKIEKAKVFNDGLKFYVSLPPEADK